MQKVNPDPIQSEDFHLFLGCPIGPLFGKALENVSPDLLHHLIHSEGDYLMEISQDNQRYIGKKIGHLTDRQTLELSEVHIRSLITRLVPDFPKEEINLVLFPYFTR